MEFITVTVVQEYGHAEFELNSNTSLLEALQSNDFYLPAICGAKGTCGKCKVKVLKGRLEITAADKRYFSKEDLNEGHRLSCTAYPDENIAISILAASEEDFSAVSYFEQSVSDEHIASARENSAVNRPNSRDERYSIGVDIGTTTIAFALINMESRTVLDNMTVVNKQREYGADVISRILNANDGKLHAMSTIVRTQISACLTEICHKNNISIDRVSDIAVAANTTMIHLLLGLSCETLGAYPFTPVTLAHMVRDYNEVFGTEVFGTEVFGTEVFGTEVFGTEVFGTEIFGTEIFEGPFKSKVHILPGISTYVGADITAGIYFSELHKISRPSMLLDIGTNGEMAIFTGSDIFCTATAAGPAFEGGNIVWGTGSVPGAISSAKYTDGEFVVDTIGGEKPIGICGSGVIDIVCECLKNGLIDKTGRLGKSHGGEVKIASTLDGRAITFTQKDVRELQLGKSAIRSGVDTLLAFAGLTYDDINTLYIAGGFGFKINFESGAALGLIPVELKNKIALIGNSSLGGTVKYLLSEKSSSELNEIIKLSKEHNLPQDKLFNNLFIQNMSFD